jgi:outer membrane protein assembly factor BamB
MKTFLFQKNPQNGFRQSKALRRILCIALAMAYASSLNAQPSTLSAKEISDFETSIEKSFFVTDTVLIGRTEYEVLFAYNKNLDRQWIKKSKDIDFRAASLVNNDQVLWRNNGEWELLSTESGSRLQTKLPSSSSPLFPLLDGTYVAGVAGGKLCVWEQWDKLLWTKENFLSTELSIVAVNKSTFAVAYTDVLFLYEIKTGDLIWKKKLPDWCNGPISKDSSGNLYVPSGNRLVAFDSKGNTLFSFATKDLIRSPAVVFGNNVYVTSSDGTLYALDLKGVIKWTSGVADGQRIYSEPTLLKNGEMLAVGSQNGVLILNKNGSSNFLIQTKNAVAMAPSIFANQLVFADVRAVLYTASLPEN